ncbi:MAG: hypothetical protein AABY22_18555 [Nanoarchaeota archaeon]|mgnify:FL=1
MMLPDRLLKDILYKEYVLNKKTMSSLAKKLKTSNRTIRIYLKKFNFIRTRKEARSLIPLKITVKKRCPNCKKVGLMRAGFTHTKSKPRKRRKYECKFCHKKTNLRTKFYKYKRYSPKVLRDIKNLIGRDKGYINKYDRRIKSYKYSPNDIAKIINKKYRGLKIYSQTIWKYMKEIEQNNQQKIKSK